MSDSQNDWPREVFRNHDRRAESLENASIESANLALRALLLLNGGASVALLGFLASIFSAQAGIHDSASLVAPFLSALGKFALGAGLAVLAAAVAYITNSAYARGLWAKQKKWEWPYVFETDESKREWGKGLIWNKVATGASLASLGMFIWGCISVGIAY